MPLQLTGRTVAVQRACACVPRVTQVRTCFDTTEMQDRQTNGNREVQLSSIGSQQIGSFLPSGISHIALNIAQARALPLLAYSVFPEQFQAHIKHSILRTRYFKASSIKPGFYRYFSTSKNLKMPKNFVGVEYPQPTPEVVNKTRNNVFDLFSLKGKVASISGSSGGIGYDVAEAYAQAGADIAIWYNSRDPAQKVEHLQKTYGVKAKAYKVAIDNYEAVEAAIQQQIKDFGKIDIFVANAGVIWDGTPSILDEKNNKAWDKVMRVNVDGVYYCAKAVGKHFRERGQGNLILTGSMSGHIINVPDTMAAYTTSKAAVNHLGKALALEWAGFARVNTVSPGYIKSDMTAAKEAESMANWGPLTPMGRMADSRELVGAYLYFASDASTFTTGSDLIVDGGYSAQ